MKKMSKWLTNKFDQCCKVLCHNGMEIELTRNVKGVLVVTASCPEHFEEIKEVMDSLCV